MRVTALTLISHGFRHRASMVGSRAHYCYLMCLNVILVGTALLVLLNWLLWTPAWHQISPGPQDRRDDEAFWDARGTRLAWRLTLLRPSVWGKSN